MNTLSSPSGQMSLTINDLVPQSGTDGIEIVRHDAFPVADLPEVPPSKKPTTEFLDAVRATGKVVYPLVVINLGDRKVVKDGLRRLESARMLKFPTVPLIEVKLNSLRGSVLGLMLNAARTANPIAELRMIVELLEGGADESLIAAATRMPVSSVRRRLQLLKLNKELRELADRGELLTSAAERLAKMAKSEQTKALRHYRKNGRLSLKDIADVRRAAAAKAVAALPAALFTSEEVVAANQPAWRVNVRQMLLEARNQVPAGTESQEVMKAIDAAIASLAAAQSMAA